MATFVLVHPAWFGGWCWKKVATILRARGNEVFAPTLTGLGERAHLANREVGLGAHIEDVASVLKFEDIRDAILVGNSSGGMVITVLQTVCQSGSHMLSISTPSCQRTAKACSTSCRRSDASLCTNWCRRRVMAG